MGEEEWGVTPNGHRVVSGLMEMLGNQRVLMVAQLNMSVNVLKKKQLNCTLENDEFCGMCIIAQ